MERKRILGATGLLSLIILFVSTVLFVSRGTSGIYESAKEIKADCGVWVYAINSDSPFNDVFRISITSDKEAEKFDSPHNDDTWAFACYENEAHNYAAFLHALEGLVYFAFLTFWIPILAVVWVFIWLRAELRNKRPLRKKASTLH